MNTVEPAFFAIIFYGLVTTSMFKDTSHHQGKEYDLVLNF